MTEYVIVVALIAVAAIGVVTVFGDNVRNLFATSAEALAGKAAGDSGAKTVDDGLRQSRDLKDFAEQAKKRR
jgi:Flp pilus assembly pilin Flp